jgi:SAM-dependent methyltransferase
MSGSERIQELPTGVIWHDIECGSYVADLGAWEDLAARGASADGASDVLDLGCGTGRVSLFLGRLGHRVTALDRDREVADTLTRRAAVAGLGVSTVVADVSSFQLDSRFDLVLAAMQLVQLLPGRPDRVALLERARAQLRPGGLFAAALLDLSGEPLDGDYTPPLPDVREVAGWVYSSQPVAIRSLEDGAAISLDRLRRAVSPGGDLVESFVEVRLELVSPGALEEEATAAGLVPEARVRIPATDDHVGSVVVVARADDG